MSGASSRTVEWSDLLEPATPAETPVGRPDDPRLHEVVEIWQGDEAALQPGRATIVGFPEDEGVHRNQGRVGAAAAPDEIRRWLSRLCPWDVESGANLANRNPIDLGNVKTAGGLEAAQQRLGTVIGEVLKAGAVPLVIGGGHETAYGHYLGYLHAGRPVGVVNLDAHLDVRPALKGQGHSGSPFRQMMEHPDHSLPGSRYACVGCQPFQASSQHLDYLRARGAKVLWQRQASGRLVELVKNECDTFARLNLGVYVSVDADVVRAADVPGVSAPNVAGLACSEVLDAVRAAGQDRAVTSCDLVEINPRFDRDGVSARWGALAIWNFLIGLAMREVIRP